MDERRLQPCPHRGQRGIRRAVVLLSRVLLQIEELDDVPAGTTSTGTKPAIAVASISLRQV
jgi:hypothetical protein